MRPSGKTRVGLSIEFGPACVAVDGLTDATERKLRIHPKEAGHSIEDLPSLTQRAAESDKLSAAEIFESLGLEVSGAGKSAEVWFVGASEQTGDEKMELDVTTEAMGTPAGGSDGGKTMQ